MHIDSVNPLKIKNQDALKVLSTRLSCLRFEDERDIISHDPTIPKDDHTTTRRARLSKNAVLLDSSRGNDDEFSYRTLSGSLILHPHPLLYTSTHRCYDRHLSPYPVHITHRTLDHSLPPRSTSPPLPALLYLRPNVFAFTHLTYPIHIPLIPVPNASHTLRSPPYPPYLPPPLHVCPCTVHTPSLYASLRRPLIVPTLPVFCAMHSDPCTSSSDHTALTP
ncbi:hypothetical protein R3P38DRAFT_3262342 [Favolaschia claudopus]|uniref:Uncharacterized protein n=1 Tax=Favolaschia claudopus TaxID=2862362 RepID=A0AAW0CME4_9AGAR